MSQSDLLRRFINLVNALGGSRSGNDRQPPATRK